MCADDKSIVADNGPPQMDFGASVSSTGVPSPQNDRTHNVHLIITQPNVTLCAPLWWSCARAGTGGSRTLRAEDDLFEHETLSI